MRAPARPALIALALTLAAGCPRPVPLLLEPSSAVFRGHRELELSSGATLPLVLDRSGPIGLCLDPPATTDTSQWEVRLFPDGGYVRPSVRLDTTVCFEAPLPGGAGGRGKLCPELRDRFDGTTQRLPCMPFAYREDGAALRALEETLAGAMGSVPALEALAARAEAARFPALALRARLIAAYQLRREGSSAALGRARALLRDGPAWAADAAAARWAGQLAYERAMLRLESEGDLARGWEHLRDAERSFRVCGDRKWIAAATKQAEILARAGSLGEAKDRLRFGLGQCASAPCDHGLVRAARTTLAWLVACDPDAGKGELATAAADLDLLLSGGKAPRDPLEHANLLLNLAIVRERRREDPGPALRAARALLAGGASARARELSGWAELVEGRRALREGHAAEAADRCDRLGEEGESARLRAFGWSCAAAAHRRLGHGAKVRERLSRALALHALSGAARLGQDVPLGPGQRAEDAYAAARAAVEGGSPAGGWAILRDLDEEVAAGLAPGQPVPAVDLAAFATLDLPASAPRRQQARAIRRAALARLQEAVRARHAPGARAGVDAVQFRAFPVDDEVVLLRRRKDGEIEIYRRTPLERERLAAAMQEVRRAMERGEEDNARWRAAVAPLARALAPRPQDLDPVTTFALHGILQEVPLAALPVVTAAGERWMGEVTSVVWQPAGVGAGEAAPPAAGPSVFVSDPGGDLGLAEERSPPGATVLRGEQATRAALREALAGARWLHVDAHARYDPAFPELSTLELADGPLWGHEVAAWGPGLVFANLSGCRTGRAPVTADSGRFGISGLLARGGVPWVLGARTALENDLARAFNRALYAALGAGAAVPDASRTALAEVAAGHPASRWAGLVLLRGGQSSPPRTPLSPEGVP